MPANRTLGMDHPHHEWSPISTRPVLRWPDNAPVALCVILVLEHMEWQAPDGSFQVARLAGMIEASDPVGLAAAAAEVHPHTPHAPVEEMLKHPGHVAPPRRSLESVQQQDDGCARRGLRRAVEIEKVAVRSPDPASLQRDGGAAAHVPPREGLRVGVAEPPCGPEGGGIRSEHSIGHYIFHYWTF